MIGWLVVIGLAALCMAVGVFLLKVPKQVWTLFAAVLMFGLAGYAWQGSPEQPGSPKAAMLEAPRNGEDLVDARRGLFDDGLQKPGYLVTSDAFARTGKFDLAAGLLRKGLEDNPKHVEGWLALAMAITEHADGIVTPAARYAYERAYAADTSNPAAPFILGYNYLRMREPREARAVWGELLNNAPADAPWRAELEQRVAALDAMMAPGGPSPPIMQGQ